MALYILLFIGSMVMLLPFVWMLLSSFKNNAEILKIPPTLWPTIFRWENYTRVWNEIELSLYFKNSLFVTVVKTGLILYTSAMIGYVLTKLEFRGRDMIFYFILATMMVPWPVTLVPLYQEMVWFGWLDTYTALIVPGIFSGFGIFMMRQFVSNIPTELIEAARIDGASEFRIVHTIVFPLVSSAISALAIFQFLWNWDDFLWPYLMINDSSKFLLPIGLAMFTGQFVTDYASMFAGTIISIIPVLIVYLLFQKRFIEGITMTGIKG